MPLPPAIRNIQERLLQGPLKDGSFIRNVMTVIAGTAISHVIAIAAIPVLARIYSPANFGALATYTVSVTILAALASLGYQAAILLPRRNESALTMLISCLAISLTISLLVAIGIGTFQIEISVWLNNPDLLYWIWLIPLGALARSWIAAFQIWNARHKQFTNTAKGVVTQRLTAESTKLGLGHFQFFDIGLMLGTLLGTATGGIYIAIKGLVNIPRHHWQQIRFKLALILLHRYRRFPMFDLFSDTIATTSRHLPVILLTYFFTPAVVGFFFIAYKMVAGPLELGATSVTQVFFQRANQAKITGDLDLVTLQVFERLLVVFFTPLSLLCLAAPELTLFILGADWQDSGVYLRWLTVSMFFTSIANPMHRIFAILERQNELAIINTLIFIVSAATLSVGGLMGDPELAIAMFAVGVSFVWIGQGLRVLYISGVPVTRYFQLLFIEALRAAPFAAALGLTRYLTDNTLIILAVFSISIGLFGLLRARFILTRSKKS
jgi:lipopolysaccharide exporter